MSNTLALVRCEHDPAYSFHCDALEQRVAGTQVFELPTGEIPSVDAVEGVIISGSTAGVYEERDWIETGRTLVKRLVANDVPTLGICFGHQLINDALGGRVEQDRFRAGLVRTSLAEDPLFEDVSPIVPVIHGDIVRETGAGLTPIASVLEYEYPLFGTRHETSPLWTVQFHPELTEEIRPMLRETFDWEEHGHSFQSVTAHRVLSNFSVLAEERADN